MLGFKITPLSIFSHELVRRKRDKSVEGAGVEMLVNIIHSKAEKV